MSARCPANPSAQLLGLGATLALLFELFGKAAVLASLSTTLHSSDPALGHRAKLAPAPAVLGKALLHTPDTLDLRLGLTLDASDSTAKGIDLFLRRAGYHGL